ncbi:MAG: alternative ribosome rescue aminoacyl-tRNA hydrolase ArfB [Mycobacteriales bacterium]
MNTAPTAGLALTVRIVVPEAELSWRFSRSSGAGGQHVNTSDTRVELSFDVANSPSLPEVHRARALDRLAGRLVDGVVTVGASERRSQLQNRQLARQRLTAVLREAIAPPPRARRPTRPGKRAVQARLDAKKHRGQIKRLRRGEPD